MILCIYVFTVHLLCHFKTDIISVSIVIAIFSFICRDSRQRVSVCVGSRADGGGHRVPAEM